MGNEHSKTKDATKNGKIPEKRENGSVNGISATITPNGLEIEVNGDTIVKQNGGPHPLNVSTESTEPDYVIIDSDCKSTEAPVISEIPEPTIPKEEEVPKTKEGKVSLFGKMFKKKAEPAADVEAAPEKETTSEDQTDVSPPAAEPQPEAGSSGAEVAVTVISDCGKDAENLHLNSETSTQTDKKIEAHISTQTGDHTTTKIGGPVEVKVEMETAAVEEESLNESPVVIAEEVVEETVYEEPFDNETTGIISKEVLVISRQAYENMVFRAERVEVMDNFEVSDSVTEANISAESHPNTSITEAEIVAEESNGEDTVPLEISSSLPKVVADCIEAVFVGVSESTDFAAGNTSSGDEVIIEDITGDAAGDMEADAALIETTEPESNEVTPEGEEANGVPTPVMDQTSEDVCEEPNPSSTNQDEEPSAPLITEILVEVEPACEEITAGDDAPVVKDAPGITEELAPAIELVTIKELPEETPADDEVKPEEVATVDENAHVSDDVTAEEGPEIADEPEPSPVDAEGIPETAIEALCQELELAFIPQEPVVINDILQEEVIIPTMIVPLSGEHEACFTIPEELNETADEETNHDANETEAVLESVEEDTTVQEASTEAEVTEAATSEEPVEGVSEEVQAESAETPEQIPVDSEEPVEEDPNLCEDDATTEVTGVLVITQESDVEAASEILEVSENTPEEPADEQVDVLQMDTTGEPAPLVLIIEEVLEEDATVHETSTVVEVIEVPSSEEPVEEVSEEVQAESAETPEQIPVSLEEPVEESPNLCEEDVATMEVMESTQESVIEVTSEILEVAENTAEEPAKEQEDTTVQEVIEVTISEEPAKEVSEETLEVAEDTAEEPGKEQEDTTVQEVIEVTISVEPAKEVSEEMLEVAENTAEASIVVIEELVEENIPVPSVLETIVEEIFSEDVAAECHLETSDEVAPQLIPETETEERPANESSANSTDPESEISNDSSTDMEALLLRLQSACSSAVEESVYRLGGLKMFSLGNSVTVTMHVTPKGEQQ